MAIQLAARSGDVVSTMGVCIGVQAPINRSKPGPRGTSALRVGENVHVGRSAFFSPSAPVTVLQIVARYFISARG